MKLLSKLKNSQELLVLVNTEWYYTIKEDLLSGNSYSIDEIESIYTASPEIVEFDLEKALYYTGEDMNAYEDWNKDVYEDLMSYSETHAFLTIIKKVLKNHKVYVPNEEVLIDIDF